MFKVGELVRYMEPLDHEYSYGKIFSIDRGMVTLEAMGYYFGKIKTVRLRYIEHLEKGYRYGSCKKCSK